MMYTVLLHSFLASVYGGGSYSTSAYSTGNAGSGGSLVDTGIAIAAIVTLAAVIALVALAVRIWKRPSKQVTEEVSEDAE